MATPLPFSQQSNFQPIAPNLSVHSAGDSNISNDLTIIGDVSSSGSVTLDGVIEGNIYCTSLIVTANGRVNGGIVANAADEARFLTSLMAGKVIGRRQLEALKTPSARSNYGLGTGVDESGCVGTAYGHNGGGDGFETLGRDLKRIRRSAQPF